MDDRDGREPVLAEGHIEATSRLLRDVLAELERGLEEADDETRRKASWLVAGLVDHWSRHRPAANEEMSLHLERTPSRVRIAATVDERVMPREDWERVGQAVATGVADEWGVETQVSAVAWFDMRVSRPVRASPPSLSLRAVAGLGMNRGEAGLVVCSTLVERDDVGSR